MSTSPDIVHLFTGIAAAVALSRVAGRLAVRLRQPPVVGEIAAGVLIGPTVLHGAVGGFLFPTDIRPLLLAVADIGLALFMFGVGLHLRPAELAKQSRATAVVTVGATVPVFLLGTGLGAVLPPGGSGGRSTASVVFLGLALSVTALPVLARILSDRGLTRTLEGTVAMASAAVVDVLAWAGLAALTAVVSDGRAIVLLFVPYLLFMLLVVRPLLARTARRPGPLALIVGALLSAAATEAMGMHLIFGALLFGLVVPRDQEDLDGGDGTGAGPAGAPSALGRLRESAEQISSLLMPAFFVLSGLSVDLSRLDVRGVGELVLVIAVAVVGKTGGTYAAARIGRLPARSAAVLPVLMNTRGLTELVVLSIGLQLGLLDQDMYSIMVVMALVTTAMTGPLLALLERRTPSGPPEPEDGDAVGREAGNRART
ncbi:MULTISPECIES: cation:proton antiporter [unclassified Streptomyces]|uniref:cation:proton antiporter n=1 Tax=unclassified Streptomyces TaxID=2593676 RepID=UPI002E2D5722|nr:cation:proton antiporter [Streptomyces sp. NBC_01429]